MSPDPLPAITAVAGIALFVASLFYFVHWAHKRVEEEFHEAARLAEPPPVVGRG